MHAPCTRADRKYQMFVIGLQLNADHAGILQAIPGRS
jgi:hypothetical protein